MTRFLPPAFAWISLALIGIAFWANDVRAVVLAIVLFVAGTLALVYDGMRKKD